MHTVAIYSVRGMIQCRFQASAIIKTVLELLCFQAVYVCVHPESLWTWHLVYCLGEFHQIFSFCALWEKDELVKFEVKRLKVKDDIRCADNSTFGPILSPEDVKWW